MTPIRQVIGALGFILFLAEIYIAHELLIIGG